MVKTRIEKEIHQQFITLNVFVCADVIPGEKKIFVKIFKHIVPQNEGIKTFFQGKYCYFLNCRTSPLHTKSNFQYFHCNCDILCLLKVVQTILIHSFPVKW